MASRDDAKRTLVHYMRLLAEAAGVKWTAEMTIEVEGIVDDILRAADVEARA